MQKNTQPNPKRFQTFTQLPNGKGFTINDTKHVFYYDKYHGWKDQHGNYYNSNAEPQSEPQSDSNNSASQENWSGDQDEYEREYGPQQDLQDDFQKGLILSESAQISITKNLQQLSFHNKQGPLRVNFEIIDIDEEQQLPSIKSIHQAYSKKIKGIINVFYDKDSNDKQLETGYFVMKNVQQATQLIKLDGQNVIGYDLTFHVEVVEDLQDDPISKEQMEKNMPQFVEIDQGEKIYVIKLENDSGFNCDKKTFSTWIKNFVSKYELVKMRKCNNGKQPIIKIISNQADKLKNAIYQNKKVILEQYIAKIENQQKKEEKVQKEEIHEKVE